MSNKANILILCATILLGAALTIWLDNSSAPPSPPVAVETLPNPVTISGEAAPDFSFTDLSGKQHQFNDFKGKTVIINFWATWCAPCVIEFPKLLELAKTHPDMVLLALSSDSDNRKIETFLKKQNNPSANVIIARDDKRRITADTFKTYKLPESLIISPDGRIAKKIVGDTDWNGKEINDFLLSLTR